MLKKIKQKGFTLIELMLVLGIATIMGLVAFQSAKRDSEYQVSNAAATQMQELNAALTKHITNNYPTLLASGRASVTIADLQAERLLPAVYLNATPFGGTISMEVVSTGGTKPTLSGLITTTPWTDGAGNVRYDLLGAAIRKIGAQGGVSYYVNNAISGLNGGWSALQGNAANQFTNITAAGQLAIRSYGDTLGYDNVYLRRDGSLPMLGNLDMGFHDINNAVNISANGWIYANHIAANDATIGSIFSNYIRNTGGIDTAQITGVGTNSTANFAYLSARTDVSTKSLNTQTGAQAFIDVGTAAGTTGDITPTPGKGILNVQDMYIRDARGSGTWLSDRLPKFSSRGIYFVTDGDQILKPSETPNATNNYTCNYAAAKNGSLFPGSTVAAKVEIIPQSFFTQGKTDGTIDFSGTTLMNDPTTNIVYGTIKANPDLKTLTNIKAYAEDNGDRWTVKISNTGDYTNIYPYNSGWALAHVYCDYS